MNIDEYMASLDGKEDTNDLDDIIQQLKDGTVEEPEEPEKTEEPENTEPEEKEESDKQDSEPNPDKTSPEAEQKPVQSKEENARFAEQRRQAQLDERVKAELERIKQEDPAYKVAQTLSEMYGRPIEQIQAELEEARLQKQAKDQNVPVEVIRQIEAERQGRLRLEEQLNRVRFDTWVSRVDRESESLKKDFPMLSDEDIYAAKSYMLQTLRNPEAPLEEAVYAIHGKKIAQALREQARNDALAEVSGRKNSTLPPQSGKAASTPTLTADEKSAAKILGLTEDEYLKWKR